MWLDSGGIDFISAALKMLRSTHHILVVDDDLDESILTERALKKCLGPRSSVHLVNNGNEAIRYMIGEGEYADRSKHHFPTLIITDLNMPDGDGFHVLEFLGSNPAWSVVPRVMFSSSSDDDDVRTAFLLGASAYHVKPMSPSALADLMRAMIAYWTSSEVPPVDEAGRLMTTNSAGRIGARYPQSKGGHQMKRVEQRAAAIIKAADHPIRP